MLGGSPAMAILFLAWLTGNASARANETAIDFVRDIKPILAARCHGCHGEKKQESGLRLDTVGGVNDGGNSGPAVVPGESGESLLVQAIIGAEGATKMPPKGPELTAEQIALVKRWIDEGAKMPADAPAAAAGRKSDHWSFQPLADPAPPAVTNSQAVRSPIDAFIVARLEAAGLAPSPEAERATLIRRASLDLVGMPPSVAEVDAFLADTRSDAYERLVERLLDSPHYGEHWGRHWLDVARYADSNGYTIDSGRSIWKYRDWVIGALNRNLPFDRFVIDQLAGDLIENPSVDRLIATGFHRNTLVNEEGGTDPEQFRVEAVVDRVSTTGAAFLGLTLGCARCHDHKYDPITQREFYQLFAIFNNCDEPTLSVPTDQQAKELPALLAEIAQVEKRLADVETNAPGRQGEWESRLLARLEAEAAVKAAEPQDSTVGKQPPDANAAEAGPQSKAPAEPEVPPVVREALAVPRDNRSEEQKKTLADAFRKVDPERIPLDKQLGELKQSEKQVKAAITTTLIVRERDKPRETHIHVRGDFLHAGATVGPGRAGHAAATGVAQRGA